MIDKEPVTIVCSKMGWIRAMTGHIDLNRELKFKDGDESRFVFHAQTTDRLLILGSNGRFYTLGASTLPGGRGMGEPLRLMVDLPNEAEITALFIHKPGNKLLVASSAGDGFIVPEDDVIAQTRAGKQVLNVKGDVRAKVCSDVTGDHVACVTADCQMPRHSPLPKGCHGSIRLVEPAQKPNWSNGRPNGQGPDAWHPVASQGTIPSRDRQFFPTKRS